MPETPRAIVIRAPGTNCDLEMCRAFEMAGAGVDLVHLDALCQTPARLNDYDLVGFPGGFSYGDDIASGRIYAMRVRERLHSPLRAAAARGVPMIGACNGFQVMVQVGLLPGWDDGQGDAVSADSEDGTADDGPPNQVLALAHNIGGRFVDRWVGMQPDPQSPCIWTRGLAEYGDEARMFPVAHGEGRLVARDEAVLRRLEESGQAAVRYSDNYNGSQGAIAGVCDPSGRIFALMPHPERFLDWNRHPWWTRLPAAVRRGPTPGLRVFLNAVEAVRGAAV
jgi:phosphoribosylformylglycinamidine synthase